MDIEPDWVHLATDANGIRMNAYFVDNPEMVLGDMQMVSGPHGMESACIAYENAELGDLLRDAIQNIHAEITEFEIDDLEAEDEDLSIPADPDVRNFSFTVVDGKIYYRENSRMNPVDVSATAESRIKGMIAIRDCVRTLIEYQTEDYPDADIKAEQENSIGSTTTSARNTGLSAQEPTIRLSIPTAPTACLPRWRCWMMRATSSARQICSPNEPSSRR